MRISLLFSTFMLICLLFGQSYGQKDFDVTNPTEEDIFLYAQAQKGEALALIPDGETLTSLESLKKGNATWHKVKWGDYTGYVDGKYLTESDGTHRKGFPTYQAVNITKLVLIHATSATEGLCYLISIDNKTQQVKIKNRFKCKFGISGIMKQKEGDKKTPLGHYCVTSESAITNDLTTVDDDEIYNKFGGYNIHLNYPNVHDSKEKKTGGGICIHGGYSRPTEGCVRIIDEGQEVSTKNIVTVGNFVTKGTHVVITNTIPSTFRQKSNTFLQPESYSFIQTVCSKVLNHNEWKSEVDNFLNPVPATTSYGPTGPADNPFASRPAATVPASKPAPAPVTVSAPAGFTAAYVKSSTGFANLRQKPNQDAKLIERIPTNQRISCKDNGTSWWEVITEKGNQGYMHKSLIVKQ
ncbi:MAG: L,D-transpeptidase family protein [Bacteroidia bacterium]|nr:L,D-transpeptidase family protein [Bacteroidia bacterium]